MSDDTAAVNASPAVATPKKKAKTAAKKPKTARKNPKVSEMVNNAIQNLKERGGSSLQAIRKHIGSNHNVDMDRLTPLIKKYLIIAVERGTLLQTKGKGTSGSFKLIAARQKTKKPAKVKKAASSVVKKAKTATKKAAKPKSPKEAAKPKSPKKAAKPKSPKKAAKPKSPKKAAKSSKPKAPMVKKIKTPKKAAPKKSGKK